MGVGVKERASEEGVRGGNEVEVEIEEADSVVWDEIERNEEGLVTAIARGLLFKGGGLERNEEGLGVAMAREWLF